MNPLQDLAFAPAERLSPSTAHLFADLILGGGLLFLVVAVAGFALVAWLRARRLDAEVWRQKGLRRGPVLLPGVVERADEDESAGPFVELTITQTGTEHRNKNTHYVRWAERERSLVARPFHLRLEGGEVVRVEPGSQVILVDRLDVTERLDRTTRRRRARLTPGETAYIRGVLEPVNSDGGGPYRGGAPLRWRLKPTRVEGLFISSEPVAHEGLAAARFHGAFAAGFLALLLLCQLVVFRPYHLVRREGVATEASIVSRRHWVTRNKSRITSHYALSLRYEAAGNVYNAEEETCEYAYSWLRDGSTVPILYAASTPDVVLLGREREIGFNAVRSGLSTMALVLLVTCYLIAHYTRRPWWRRKTLVETQSGTLG